jgi:molybdopterin molybdotransferase
MIRLADAERIVFEHTYRTGEEECVLGDAAGRVLARDVPSDLDFPPFDKASMDGFACRAEDLGQALTVVETLPAGTMPTCRIGPGQCARIMTGACVPEGADTIFMIEQSETMADKTVRFSGTMTRSNLCRRAEDVRAGEIVLNAGTRLDPRHIAVLAAVGVARPLVTVRPRVAILATGDELVEPWVKPGPSQIRNSNGWQLAAQVTQAGGVATYCGIARDDLEGLRRRFGEAAATSDVVILSGGVSKGDFDRVPEMLMHEGVKTLFDGIAIKPGKPTTFGIRDDLAVFGLPGNPVSTYVVFEILVKPFLLAMAGHTFMPRWTMAPLARDVRRRSLDRDEWIPVRIDADGSAQTIDYHGSADFVALARADGLTLVPAGTDFLPAGTNIRVRTLPS